MNSSYPFDRMDANRKAILQELAKHADGFSSSATVKRSGRSFVAKVTARAVRGRSVVRSFSALGTGSDPLSAVEAAVVALARSMRPKPKTSRAAAPRRNPPRPVENDAFKRWFKGSIVVDVSGRPKILYHGTRSSEDFEVFRTGTIRPDDDDGDGEVIVTGSGDPGAFLGPHFAEEPQVASNFAEGRAASWDKSRYAREGSAGGRVIPVVLSLRKVATFDGEESMLRWIVENGESRAVDDELELMLDEGEIDVDQDDDEAAEEAMNDYDNRMAALDRIRGYDSDVGNPLEDAYEELGTSARAKLIAQGVDGIKYKNEIEGGTSWVALEPGTVKSAIGNNGRWDREDPSILR